MLSHICDGPPSGASGRALPETSVAHGSFAEEVEVALSKRSRTAWWCAENGGSLEARRGRAGWGPAERRAVRPPRRALPLVALTTVALILAGCSRDSGDRRSPTALNDDAITVASFDFPESELLAEIYSQALEAGGYDVQRQFRLGSRNLVGPALAVGLVEFVPGYVGTSLQFWSLGAAVSTRDVETTRQALVHALRRTSVVALASAPAQDANTFVVLRETAERYGLHDLSDLQRIAPQLTFGGPPECATRPLCLAGLRRLYGLEFGHLVTLDAGGPLTHQALEERHVDIALLFTTDPSLTKEGLVELVDDRGLQPAENVTPLVRTEVIQRWGSDFVDLVDAVSRHLTTDGLRNLNAQMEQAAGDARGVASAWLTAQGLTDSQGGGR